MVVSPLGHTAGPSLRRPSLPLHGPLRSIRQHGRVAWVVAIAGPILITLGSLPFRSTLGAAGGLFFILLAVVAVGMLGGIRPALTALVLGFLSTAYFFAEPYQDLGATNPVDLVALIAFVIVGGSVGILVDSIVRLAEEQASLRQVATLVARAAPPKEVFAAVTEEVGRLLAVDFTAMGRYESGGMVTFVAIRTGTDETISLATPWSLGGNNVTTLVSQTGRTARMERPAEFSDPAADIQGAGIRSSIGAPIMVGGRLWGVMIAATRKVRPLPRDTEARLADFIDLVATAIANAESQAALAASRARIVAAADETRRRIERDLHDGAQQQLVLLALGLRGAIESVPGELPELAAKLTHSERGVQELLDEVREISRGLHPAILSEAGLRAALKSLARRSLVPVELDVRVVGRLPTSIEVAAYYVVSEALANTAKHAAASVAKVTVEQHDGLLRVEISDDGVGGADPERGSGLLGLIDRVEALGGTVAISSSSSAGTTMVAELPT